MTPSGFARWRGGRARPDPDDERKQEQSWAELKAGRLPLSAQERLATQAAEHVFTSALSTRDLVAVRACGYEPVGQAFGTATMRLNRLVFAGYAIHPNAYVGSYRYGTLVVNPTMISAFHDGERQARTKALARMTAECRALGGEGVLGVAIHRSRPTHDLYEFTVIGTVVRRVDRPPGQDRAEPWTTTMSAAEVGALERGGWRPVHLLYELQRFGNHAGYLGNGGGRLNPMNYQTGEVTAAVAVLEYGRSRVRELLNRRLPAGGGMILDELSGEIDRHECTAIDGQSDFVVDVEAIGTAIEAIGPARPPSARPALDIMPVVRLDDMSTGGTA